MEKRDMIYEGKAKQIYSTSENDQAIVHFKDDATAFDGQKKSQITGKGKINNKISNFFFKLLEDRGIKTHLIEELNERDSLVKKVDIILVEVVVRNIVAGSLSKRLGIKEGKVLDKPVLEYYYKNDDLGDPLINNFHIEVLELSTESDLEKINKMAFKINKILKEFLNKREIDLVDFKLEFGYTEAGEIILADEISPDTCRFWDINTREKLDKDRFRRDLGNVEAAYQEMLKRIIGKGEL